MDEWLEQASQWHGMYCHDLQVMSSNPGWVELGVRSTSVLSRTWTINIKPHSIYFQVPGAGPYTNSEEFAELEIRSLKTESSIEWIQLAFEIQVK